jgi:23S rRNA (cytidine2498-2'-O)-methyltransferase
LWGGCKKAVSQHEGLILTAHPEFIEAALEEVQGLSELCAPVEQLAPGMVLCPASSARSAMRLVVAGAPMFVRHLAPVQATVPLSGTEQDIGELAIALAVLPAFSLLDQGQRFAVQARLLPREGTQRARAYSSGILNQRLAAVISEETGAVESIKKPRVVVSVLAGTAKGYVGISLVEENLSAWPGGERHFAHTSEQISRAEFKLLEALEVFDLALPEGGSALDLGAAPGGWTRILLEAGMQVVAVDPGQLAPVLQRHPRLEYQRSYAEAYLASAQKQARRFDVITNDMRMDARDAARLLAEARRLLERDGIVLSVLKLPHVTSYLQPLPALREALEILRGAYGIVRARQLFHNRQEVTIVAARPLPMRGQTRGRTVQQETLPLKGR